ncbi:MAG: roadblock/LC7 domain-containing protein [Candidatus Saliniplasma sp.]
MNKAVVLDTIKKLGSLKGIDICILLKKNGDIITSAGHDVFISLETFGIMSATIYGAANTANEQLDKEKPERIMIRSKDGDTIIEGVQGDYILVVRSKKTKNLSKLLKYIDKAIKRLKKNLGD